MIISGTYNLQVNENWRWLELQEVYIECDTTSGPVTINLFDIADIDRFWNAKFYISDISNNASTNNITINCSPSDTINYSNVTSAVINTNGGRGLLFIVTEGQWGFANLSEIPYTAYDTIQDHGSNMPKRSILDFQGGGVVVTDNGSKTIATILSGNSFGLFSQTSDSIPIANTTIEGSLIDGGIGTLTVPANGFQVGSSFTASLSGIINSRNNDTLTIRLKTASGILFASTGPITMPNTTNKFWDIEAHFTVRQIGGAGVASIVCSGGFTYSKNASNAFEGGDFSNINNTTFNTTISNTLQITAQWGVADPLNSIYTQYFTLYKTF